MATIATTTSAAPVDWPGHATIARDLTTGYLYATFFSSTANTLATYQSINGGTSWSSYASFTRAGLAFDWTSTVIDKNGWLHMGYRVNESSTDKLYYRRLDLTTAVWGTELLVAADANGGTGGAVWNGLDLAVVRHANGAYAIAMPSTKVEGTTRYGMIVHGISITEPTAGNPTGTVYLNNGIMINNQGWWDYGTSPGVTIPSCDIEHNGDGFTAATPNLWVVWGRTKLKMVRMTWQGANVGWQGPSDYQTIDSAIGATSSVLGRWDGTRFSMCTIDDNFPNCAYFYERNQANAATAEFLSPTHPQGNLRNVGLSYEAVNKNLRLYAVGTSNSTLYYVDYTRATQTWGSWTQVTADTILNFDEYSLKRGGSYGNARHDLMYVQSGSPNNVKHVAQVVAYAPNIATWDTSAQPYFNGGAADVNATLTLDWTFTDNDPADVQGSYALSRQIGAGALQYYTAAGGTWGGSEVQNSTATTAAGLASSWGSGSDANHTYKVKVWDAANTPAAGYSAALVLIPSVKVNPSITAPTAAQVITTDTVTVTWTASEQKTRRVRLLTNPGSNQVYDSGFVTTGTLSLTIPISLGNGTGWTIELTTTNNEGLASTTQTRSFTVLYTAPPAQISTVTAVPASGWMAVVGAALAPVGIQPATASTDLYRRVKAASATNLTSNPSMAGNVTGWTGVGTTTMAYSTVQFHDSPGAALATPTGAAGLSLVRHTALTDIVAGSMYHASGWIRPTTSNKSVLINLDWYTAASAFISSSTITVNGVGTAWQYLEVVADPSVIATAAKVTMSVGESGTPAAGDTFYADELKLRIYDPAAGTRIATVKPANSTVNDSGAAGSTDYEYRWYVIGTNGAAIYSPWTG